MLCETNFRRHLLEKLVSIFPSELKIYRKMAKWIKTLRIEKEVGAEIWTKCQEISSYLPEVALAKRGAIK